MNILFIGPYRQNDGWGAAAKDYLSCLLKANENTAAVPIYMSNNIDHTHTPDMLSAEKKTYQKYDVVIQQVLPHLFEKHDAYTIGIYLSETKNLDRSVFIDYINILDELWVSSFSEKTTLQESGVTIKISVVPQPLDIDKLEAHDDAKPFDFNPNNFVFYISGAYVDRNNIPAAIIAFNREFTTENDVDLLIHTSMHNMHPQQIEQMVTTNVKQLKQRLRLFIHESLYKNEHIIIQPLSDEQTASLHKTGDCFLLPSRAESYCGRAIEALYFGNSVVCTGGIHTCSIIDPHFTGVDSMEVPIYTEQPPAQHIYTSWETWNEISILDLQKKMRQAYEKGKTPTNTTRDWVKKNLSYPAVAEVIKCRLSQI